MLLASPRATHPPRWQLMQRGRTAADHFYSARKISYGKLAQALEYGALTLQVEANFDQILKLVRVLSERLGIYLLNSINPFRIEGQKRSSSR